MNLSICIPSLNSAGYLRSLLESIQLYPPRMTYEIIVVDNGSTDGTREMLDSEFPGVILIENATNLGFTKPANQALKAASGDFMLLLNPDTLLKEDTFTPQVAYLQANPEVGISIPKVLNADGTFQKQSRRGVGDLVEAIGYQLRIGRLFPKNRKLNGYLQSWLPEDEIAEVKAVSGSCMFIRRETWQEVGDFDELFFAYQEDSDYCMRAREAGWKVIYVPLTSIIHFGGQGGSRSQPWRSIVEWHRSYYRYYRKHFARRQFFLVNWLFYVVIWARLGLALLVNLFRKA